jgi:hypothetical protein
MGHVGEGVVGFFSQGLVSVWLRQNIIPIASPLIGSNQENLFKKISTSDEYGCFVQCSLADYSAGFHLREL